MKTCTSCKENKPLDHYYKNKRAKDGLTYKCKVCTTETTARWKKDNPEKVSEHNKNFRATHREERAKAQQNYYQNNREYYLEKYKESSHKYRGLYKEKYKDAHKTPERKAVAKAYRENNKELIRYHRKKRKAMLRGSVVDFSEVEYISVMNRFGGKCALSDSNDIHMDHFIPVSTGYGDTVIGNMVPLDASLNLSKNAKNPFEWINERNDIDRKRFEDVVFYLAEQNGLSAEEYEAHVYNCFN